jgi:RNA polymerase sigma factor for flagellar operon FliA
MVRGAAVWLEERARRTLSREEYQRLRPLVRRAVMRLSAEAPKVSFDELSAWAWEGVLDAVERSRGDLDPEEALAYAAYRAHGALLDALAERCPRARTARAASERLTTIIRDLEHRTGSPPHEDAIAVALGLSRAAYAEVLDAIAESGVARLEVVVAAPSFATAVKRVATKPRPDLRSALADAIAALPSVQRELFVIHLHEGRSLTDAGDQLGLAPKRARALHVEAIHRLRARLTSARSATDVPSLPVRDADPG